jgi:putative MATE family efflux protein
LGDAGDREEAAGLAAAAALPLIRTRVLDRERVRGGALGPASVRTIMALALPTIVEQLLQAVIGLTDTSVAGHFRGGAYEVAAASAAVGIMNYLQWFAGLMTSAFGVGATAIVARSIGARRPRVASRVAGTALTAAVLVGLVVALLLFAFAPQVVWACGLRQQAALFGQQYLRIMTITIALQTAAQIGMACLRGAGDTMRPMFITGSVVVINVLTTTTFSFGLFGMPAWGIRGNAFGTMVAFLIGGAATLVVLLSGRAKVKLQLRHFRLIPHVLRRVLRIGAPSWLEGLLLWVGQFAIVILVINRTDLALGASGVTMAAHNTVLRIESIAFLPGFAFGIAASALVGQYLGARAPDQAKRAAHLANRLAIGTMTAAALPMVVVPGLLLKLVVNSDPVVRAGFWPMVLAGLAQPGFAVAIIMGSGLRGAGETVWPMVTTLTGMFLVRVPVLLAMLLVFWRYGHADWGLTAVWIGIVVDLYYRGVVNGIVFRRGRWQTKRV